MFRKLLKTEEIEVATSAIRCATTSTAPCAARGATASEVMFGPADRIIMDDDSMYSLESRVVRLVPAMIYSRALRGGSSDGGLIAGTRPSAERPNGRRAPLGILLSSLRYFRKRP